LNSAETQLDVTPRFDRFDIAEAYYLAAQALSEGGVWRRRPQTYAQLERMSFRARPSLAPGSLSENGKAIYDALVEAGL